MSSPVITIDSKKTIQEAAQIMDKHVIGGLPVVDGDKPVGIITERDMVRRAIAKGLNPTEALVKECMTKDIITVEKKSSLMDVSQLMHKNYFRRLIITDKKKIVGIITAKDLIRIMSQG